MVCLVPDVARTPDPLEVVFQVVVNCHVHAGHLTWVLHKGS